MFAAMRGKLIRTHQSLLFDLERGLGDNCCIRQTRNVEMQNAARLFPGRIITEVECSSGGQHPIHEVA
jgi:hypothetical protein